MKIIEKFPSGEVGRVCEHFGESHKQYYGIITYGDEKQQFAEFDDLDDIIQNRLDPNIQRIDVYIRIGGTSA